MKSRNNLKKIGLFGLGFAVIAGSTVAVATSCSAASTQPDFVKSLTFAAGTPNNTYTLTQSGISFNDGATGLSAGSLANQKNTNESSNIVKNSVGTIDWSKSGWNASNAFEPKNSKGEVIDFSKTPDALALNSEFSILQTLSTWLMNYTLNSSDVLANLFGDGKGDENLLTMLIKDAGLSPSSTIVNVASKLANFKGGNANVSRYRVKSIDLGAIDWTPITNSPLKYGDKVIDNNDFNSKKIKLTIPKVTLNFDYWYTENGSKVLWTDSNNGSDPLSLTINNLQLDLRPATIEVKYGPKLDQNQKIYIGGYEPDSVEESNKLSYNNMSIGSLTTTAENGKAILSGTFLTDTIKHARGDYINTDLRQWFNNNKTLFQDWIKTFN